MQRRLWHVLPDAVRLQDGGSHGAEQRPDPDSCSAWLRVSAADGAAMLGSSRAGAGGCEAAALQIEALFPAHPKRAARVRRVLAGAAAQLARLLQAAPLWRRALRWQYVAVHGSSSALARGVGSSGEPAALAAVGPVAVPRAVPREAGAEGVGADDDDDDDDEGGGVWLGAGLGFAQPHGAPARSPAQRNQRGGGGAAPAPPAAGGRASRAEHNAVEALEAAPLPPTVRRRQALVPSALASRAIAACAHVLPPASLPPPPAAPEAGGGLPEGVTPAEAALHSSCFGLAGVAHAAESAAAAAGEQGIAIVAPRAAGGASGGAGASAGTGATEVAPPAATLEAAAAREQLLVSAGQREARCGGPLFSEWDREALASLAATPAASAQHTHSGVHGVASALESASLLGGGIVSDGLDRRAVSLAVGAALPPPPVLQGLGGDPALWQLHVPAVATALLVPPPPPALLEAEGVAAGTSAGRHATSASSGGGRGRGARPRSCVLLQGSLPVACAAAEAVYRCAAASASSSAPSSAPPAAASLPAALLCGLTSMSLATDGETALGLSAHCSSSSSARLAESPSPPSPAPASPPLCSLDITFAAAPASAALLPAAAHAAGQLAQAQACAAAIVSGLWHMRREWARVTAAVTRPLRGLQARLLSVEPRVQLEHAKAFYPYSLTPLALAELYRALAVGSASPALDEWLEVDVEERGIGQLVAAVEAGCSAVEALAVTVVARSGELLLATLGQLLAEAEAGLRDPCCGGGGVAALLPPPALRRAIEEATHLLALAAVLRAAAAQARAVWCAVAMWLRSLLLHWSGFRQAAAGAAQEGKEGSGVKKAPHTRPPPPTPSDMALVRGALAPAASPAAVAVWLHPVRPPTADEGGHGAAAGAGGGRSRAAAPGAAALAVPWALHPHPTAPDAAAAAAGQPAQQQQQQQRRQRVPCALTALEDQLEALEAALLAEAGAPPAGNAGAGPFGRGSAAVAAPFGVVAGVRHGGAVAGAGAGAGGVGRKRQRRDTRSLSSASPSSLKDARSDGRQRSGLSVSPTYSEGGEEEEEGGGGGGRADRSLPAAAGAGPVGGAADPLGLGLFGGSDSDDPLGLGLGRGDADPLGLGIEWGAASGLSEGAAAAASPPASAAAAAERDPLGLGLVGSGGGFLHASAASASPPAGAAASRAGRGAAAAVTPASAASASMRMDEDEEEEGEEGGMDARRSASSSAAPPPQQQQPEQQQQQQVLERQRRIRELGGRLAPSAGASAARVPAAASPHSPWATSRRGSRDSVSSSGSNGAAGGASLDLRAAAVTSAAGAGGGSRSRVLLQPYSESPQAPDAPLQRLPASVAGTASVASPAGSPSDGSLAGAASDEEAGASRAPLRDARRGSQPQAALSAAAAQGAGPWRALPSGCWNDPLLPFSLSRIIDDPASTLHVVGEAAAASQAAGGGRGGGGGGPRMRLAFASALQPAALALACAPVAAQQALLCDFADDTDAEAAARSGGRADDCSGEAIARKPTLAAQAMALCGRLRSLYAHALGSALRSQRDDGRSDDASGLADAAGGARDAAAPTQRAPAPRVRLVRLSIPLPLRAGYTPLHAAAALFHAASVSIAFLDDRPEWAPPSVRPLLRADSDESSDDGHAALMAELAAPAADWSLGSHVAVLYLPPAALAAVVDASDPSGACAAFAGASALVVLRLPADALSAAAFEPSTVVAGVSVVLLPPGVHTLAAAAYRPLPASQEVGVALATAAGTGVFVKPAAAGEGRHAVVAVMHAQPAAATAATAADADAAVAPSVEECAPVPRVMEAPLSEGSDGATFCVALPYRDLAYGAVALPIAAASASCSADPQPLRSWLAGQLQNYLADRRRLLTSGGPGNKDAGEEEEAEGVAPPVCALGHVSGLRLRRLPLFEPAAAIAARRLVSGTLPAAAGGDGRAAGGAASPPCPQDLLRPVELALYAVPEVSVQVCAARGVAVVAYGGGVGEGAKAKRRVLVLDMEEDEEQEEEGADDGDYDEGAGAGAGEDGEEGEGPATDGDGDAEGDAQEGGDEAGSEGVADLSAGGGVDDTALGGADAARPSGATDASTALDGMDLEDDSDGDS
jgi:hypothetical protein